MGVVHMGRSLWIEKSSNRTWSTLHESTRENLKGLLEEVANLPKPTDHPKVTILEGPKTTVYRLRRGDYRVVFTTVKGELRVHKVGKRGSVYDKVNNVYEAVS